MRITRIRMKFLSTQQKALVYRYWMEHWLCLYLAKMRMLVMLNGASADKIAENEIRSFTAGKQKTNDWWVIWNEVERDGDRKEGEGSEKTKGWRRRDGIERRRQRQEEEKGRRERQRRKEEAKREAESEIEIEEVNKSQHSGSMTG